MTLVSTVGTCNTPWNALPAAWNKVEGQRLCDRRRSHVCTKLTPITTSVKQAFDMGAAAVGATVYFGSAESRRQIWGISQAFQQAHEMGMATILWCYTRNPAIKRKEKDYHVSADLTGQANHLGVTIEADIVKQKLPENNGGYTALNFGKTHKKVYEELSSDHPIDLTRYQVANGYMGRAGLINSGGPSECVF